MSSTALRHVGWCSGVAASAQQALREAAVAARDSGDSISDIADAAGTTRQTIYRWIAQETGEAGGSPVATIRAAMTMLAGYLPGNQSSQVMARAHGDADMMLRGMMMARSWVTPQVVDALTDEDRALLGLAAQAEDRVRSAKAAGNRAPGDGEE